MSADQYFSHLGVSAAALAPPDPAGHGMNGAPLPVVTERRLRTATPIKLGLQASAMGHPPSR